MKKRSKTILVISICLLVFALFIPYDYAKVADGGSVIYYAVAYTALHKHSFKDLPTYDGDGNAKQVYIVGWKVDVFGYEVYNNCHEEEETFKSSI